MSTWTGRALLKIRREISEGASDRIDADLLDSTRDKFLANFTGETEEQWVPHRAKVLRLSRLAGSVALLATWVQSYLDSPRGASLPGTVKEEHVNGGIALVAKSLCPKSRAGYCKNFLDTTHATEAESVRQLLIALLPSSEEASHFEAPPLDSTNTTDWDWQPALATTLEAIKDHAALRLGTGLVDVESALRPYFQDSSEEEWRASEASVTHLSGIAGALSSAATIITKTSTHWPPNQVEDEHLFGAIAIAARHLCPMYAVAAGYCGEYYATQYDPLVADIQNVFSDLTAP